MSTGQIVRDPHGPGKAAHAEAMRASERATWELLVAIERLEAGQPMFVRKFKHRVAEGALESERWP
jgi:hypothetical protein